MLTNCPSDIVGGAGALMWDKISSTSSESIFTLVWYLYEVSGIGAQSSTFCPLASVILFRIFSSPSSTISMTTVSTLSSNFTIFTTFFSLLPLFEIIRSSSADSTSFSSNAFGGRLDPFLAMHDSGPAAKRRQRAKRKTAGC
jgi:hypothetical protein